MKCEAKHSEVTQFSMIVTIASGKKRKVTDIYNEV